MMLKNCRFLCFVISVALMLQCTDVLAVSIKISNTYASNSQIRSLEKINKTFSALFDKEMGEFICWVGLWFFGGVVFAQYLSVFE